MVKHSQIMDRLSYYFLLNYLFIFAHGQTLKIGAIFEGPSDEAEIAFKYAVETANNEILAPTNSRQLEAVPIRVYDSNEFMVSKKLCRTLRVSFSSFLSLHPQHVVKRRSILSFDNSQTVFFCTQKEKHF
uniref:Uncharacterized protein n=1 Tax=Lutzomyia longipalpis TaxID=7200 RepID=A0A1B0GGY8_LUTLO